MGGAGKDRAAGRQRGSRAAGGGGHDAGPPATRGSRSEPICACFVGPIIERDADGFPVRLAYYPAERLCEGHTIAYGGAATLLLSPHLPRSAADPDAPSSQPPAAER